MFKPSSCKNRLFGQLLVSLKIIMLKYSLPRRFYHIDIFKDYTNRLQTDLWVPIIVSDYLIYFQIERDYNYNNSTIPTNLN